MHRTGFGHYNSCRPQVPHLLLRVSKKVLLRANVIAASTQTPEVFHLLHLESTSKSKFSSVQHRHSHTSVFGSIAFIYFHSNPTSQFPLYRIHSLISAGDILRLMPTNLFSSFDICAATTPNPLQKHGSMLRPHRDFHLRKFCRQKRISLSKHFLLLKNFSSS